MLYMINSNWEYQRETGYMSEIKARELRSATMNIMEIKQFRQEHRLQRLLYGAVPKIELKLAPELDPEKCFYEFAVRHEEAFLKIPDYWMPISTLYFIASEAFLNVMNEFGGINYQIWPARIYLKNGARADKEKQFYFCFIRDRIFVSDMPNSILKRNGSELENEYRAEQLLSIKSTGGDIVTHLIASMVENEQVHRALSKIPIFGQSWLSENIWANDNFIQACREAKLTGLREFGSTKSGYLEGVGYVKYRGDAK